MGRCGRGFHKKTAQNPLGTRTLHFYFFLEGEWKGCTGRNARKNTGETRQGGLSVHIKDKDARKNECFWYFLSLLTWDNPRCVGLEHGVHEDGVTKGEKKGRRKQKRRQKRRHRETRFLGSKACLFCQPSKGFLSVMFTVRQITQRKLTT